MELLIKIKNYLDKHNFDAEHFVKSEDWEEHLTIYDNNDTDLYKVSVVNGENILLQSYCSTLYKTFTEKTKLKEFLKKDIQQYL